MKLTDFEYKKHADRALKENYKLDLDVSKMSLPATKEMLKKIRILANEAKQDTYGTPTPSYMKLVFLEESLVDHYNKLLSMPKPKIIIENEKVEESQVILAAQDMCNTIQKMLEDVGQMQVKELPALVDGIESEIGANEAQSYNESVGAQLETLSANLKEAFAALKSARDTLTGETPTMDFDSGMDAGEEVADVSIDQQMPDGEEEVDAEVEMPEPQPVGGAGRPKR